MNTGEELIGFMLLAVLVAVIFRYYWLRVLSVAAILFAWALVAVVAPFYFVAEGFSKGNYGLSFFTLLVSAVLFIPWVIAFRSALNWIMQEKRFDRWTKLPWNTR
ncbi:hypothetical protein [Terasakiella sp.]|uniref:hypothetical protein n=1 Tax=Terasakiella sp. TaxID=2034861 RepID=UPI003AA7F06F